MGYVPSATHSEADPLGLVHAASTPLARVAHALLQSRPHWAGSFCGEVELTKKDALGWA